MSQSVLSDSDEAVFKALADESRITFSGVVTDVEKHVVPTMAMIARSLVVIGGQLRSGEIDRETADLEVSMQARAAASVIVGFANEILLNVQNLINAVLGAVRDVVNAALRVAIL